jgi:hypothetical protein
MQRESLEFHIRENDYFGTVATILDLIRQDLDRAGYERHSQTLAGLRDELTYLQQSCRMEVKYENRPSSPLHTVHLPSITGRNEGDMRGRTRLGRQ